MVVKILMVEVGSAQVLLVACQLDGTRQIVIYIASYRWLVARTLESIVKFETCPLRRMNWMDGRNEVRS